MLQTPECVLYSFLRKGKGSAGDKLPFARCLEASRYAIFELGLPVAGATIQAHSHKASLHEGRCHKNLFI